MIVEVAGVTHRGEDEVRYDAACARFLEEQGWQVLRVWIGGRLRRGKRRATHNGKHRTPYDLGLCKNEPEAKSLRLSISTNAFPNGARGPTFEPNHAILTIL